MSLDHSDVAGTEREPLLSVLIPTRNRLGTLVHTVANVLEHGGDDLEVVIHDTSDEQRAEAELASRFAGDARLRYVYSAPPMSFAETFDKTVSLARGRFVTIVGDDDGIGSALALAATLADEQGWDAISPTLPAAYNWPDFRHAYYGDSDAGRLVLRDFSGAVSTLDAPAELRSSARNSFQTFDRLPRIYYGVVRRSCLDDLRADAGGCFFGASPDISGAVGLAQYVRTLVRIDYPLFVPGSSARSGAGLSGMKQHAGSLAETPQTAAFAATWPPQVPPVYSVQTVWAQAALATLDEVDKEGTGRRLNVGRLHAQTLVHNPKFAQPVLASLAANVRCSWWRAPGLLAGFVVGGLREAAWRARGLGYRIFKRGYYRYDYTRTDLPDIQVAVNALEQQLQGRGESFDRVAQQWRVSGA
ncbi:hypothetical protein GCM10023350_38060 [Nocardioides endophyticus]|uniref:Glycosyltransferase 2-like domain-containing protein n=1 Tax=Nocardioides endophyticus TaxID=1353775 RepID=A0ABP8Z8E5_9ACTN